ncbi:RNA-binding protein [Candidatus Pacearchaeota archaeon]|nr:MAG: RNA-binding protein [Candidatus Pacearchaeota archaeon]
MVSAELLPLASPRFEMGPPDFQTIELGRLVDRVLRESGFIDFEKLVITPGEKVWNVMVDIYPINDDGNLIDISTIAAVRALQSAKVPVLDSDGKIDYTQKSTESLTLNELKPVSISFFKLGNSLLLDPTREEEEACDARITFGLSRLNGKLFINSCQKKGESTLSKEELSRITEILESKYDELSAKF